MSATSKDKKKKLLDEKRLVDSFRYASCGIVEAYKELGLEYAFEPIRGGTDGAHLTYRGLPCPNLATGDYNCHGRFEYVDVDEMKKMIEVVYKIVTK